MNKRFRMRPGAPWIFTAAVLGASLMTWPAEAQDYRGIQNDHGYLSSQIYRNNPVYRPTRSYEEDGRVQRSPATSVYSPPRRVNVQPQQNRVQPQQNWQSHMSRVAQLESQLSSLKVNRVPVLESEIEALSRRLDASGEMLHSCQSAYGADCGSSTGCCEPCCPPVQNGFYAGFEFLWLKPHFDNSIAFLSRNDGEIAGDMPMRGDARSHEFDYDYGLAPRIFLGYTGDCGLGVRTRFFQFDQSSNKPFFAVPAGGDLETLAIQPYLGSGEHFFMDNGGASAFRAAHSMELNSWELEATNQLTFCRSLVTLGAGLRYVSVEQRYRVDAIHANGHIQETLYNQHDFEGVGPTLACELLRPIQCCSGLSLYATTRFSVLFGETDQYFKKVDGDTGAITETFTRTAADESLFIGEVGLGLQYTRGKYYARGGWEGQYWQNAGGPTTNDGDFGLNGLSLTLGLNY